MGHPLSDVGKSVSRGHQWIAMAFPLAPRPASTSVDTIHLMSPPSTVVTPSVPADPTALRIVLFGMPDAGKSSLLGALAQATHTQDRILQGRLVDQSNGLAELWRRVYEDRQRETLEEIVPYPITFDPYSGDPGAIPKLNVMLYDCDGRVANELLSQRKSLLKDVQAGSLAKAVLDADALILTVDASASNEQIEIDFREFIRFLRVLETYRGNSRAVGGLPVLLALTKCDLLAREPISKKEWQDRIAERQKQVKERFAHYLEGNAGAAGAVLTFGSLDLRVFPTAVRRPVLAESPAQPREPLGVAELFHDCLRSAYNFRQRTVSADRRLKMTVAGVGSFLAVAAAFAFFLIEGGGPIEKPPALTDRVAQFEARDKPLPDRLANERLQHRANELVELRDHPDFNKLPEDKKNFVRDRFDELQAYLNLREQLGLIGTPDKARDLDELNAIQKKLENQSVIPANFQKDWQAAPPPAVVERNRRLADCQTIRDNVDQLRGYFTSLQTKASDRLFDKEFHVRWDEQVAAIVAAEDKPPIPRGGGASAAYEFKEVQVDEKEWLNVRKKLLGLRDLARALGLIGDGSDAVLVISALPFGADMNRFSATKLEELSKKYPAFKTWSLANVPDALHDEVRKKLNRSYEQMILDGQRMIVSKLRQVRPTGDDERRHWKEIAAWLLSQSLQEWHDLLGFVSKLLDPASDDPVSAAAAFLNKDSFEMDIRAVTVTIPKQPPLDVMQPGAEFQIHWKPKGKDAAKTTLTFALDRSRTVDGPRDKRAHYLLKEGSGQFVFKPGDGFSGEQQLTRVAKTWLFVWSNERAASFAFDALAREPYMELPGAKEHGVTAEGVTLSVEGRFPTVPVLVPDARRDRK